MFIFGNLSREFDRFVGSEGKVKVSKKIIKEDFHTFWAFLHFLKDSDAKKTSLYWKCSWRIRCILWRYLQINFTWNGKSHVGSSFDKFFCFVTVWQKLKWMQLAHDHTLLSFWQWNKHLAMVLLKCVFFQSFAFFLL